MTFSAEEWSALTLTLKVAAVALAGGLPVSILLALALARGRFAGRALLDGVVHLPLVLPPVVTGYLLLVLFGRQGPAGAFLDQVFGVTLAFRWTGAALAAAIMALPIMVRPIRLAIEAVDPDRLEAADVDHPAMPHEALQRPVLARQHQPPCSRRDRTPMPCPPRQENGRHRGGGVCRPGSRRTGPSVCPADSPGNDNRTRLRQRLPVFAVALRFSVLRSCELSDRLSVVWQ